MEQIKLSDYMDKGASGEIKDAFKAEMDRLDALQQNWSILIDADWNLTDGWTTYIKNDGYPHSDYEYLESIDVVDGIKDFKSSHGCLLDKKGNLVFAPKMKREQEISAKNGIVGIQVDNTIAWNEVQSKPIRTNFSIFVQNSNYRSQHKSYFEELLMLYKENIFESIFVGLLDRYHLHEEVCISRIESKDIKLDKIILSSQIKYRQYGLNEDYKKSDEYNENLEETYEEKKEESDIENGEETDGIGNFSSVLYGEYYPNQRLIVLYVEAMKKSGKTGRDLEDLFLSVLIHEYFHAVHYTFCEMNGQHKPFGVENEIIVESLAASFEHHFCDDVLRNSVLTKELEESWKKHSVLVYPYSGAKQIVGAKYDGYRSRKFIDKLDQIEDELDKQGIRNDRVRDLRHMLCELARISHDGLLYFESYFFLSLVSMEQAQMDLLSKCL